MHLRMASRPFIALILAILASILVTATLFMTVSHWYFGVGGIFGAGKHLRWHFSLRMTEKMSHSIRVFNDSKRCMIQALEKLNITDKESISTAFKQLPQITLACNRQTFSVISLAELRNSDDVKFVLAYKNDSFKTGCSHVTLGVGGDVTAEENLLKLSPNCKLYGCDPSLKNGKIFKTIGTYRNVAVVHSSTGFAPVRVMMDQKYQYEEQMLQTMSMSSFFDNMSIGTVDSLFVDIEGHEFELLKSFERESTFSKRHVACVVTLEMHWQFLTKYRDWNFQRSFLNFLRRSDYAAIHVPDFRIDSGVFVQQFALVLVNYKSPACLNKLLK